MNIMSGKMDDKKELEKREDLKEEEEKHEETESPKEPREYKCKKCGQVFKTRDALERHAAEFH